jgi:BirA family biotin operon repressor/biotin-[acetyl-CoA-carboxylase] ligase
VSDDRLGDAVRGLSWPWHGQYFETVDSTQDEARSAANAGAPDRSVFVADFQRAGRGRQGRSWLAPPGAGLLMSLLFRSGGVAAPTPWRFTSLVALSLVEAIPEVVTGLAPAIKWPNDVMLDDRKLAGVLAETIWSGDRLRAVVGVGVNVNATPGDLARVPNATSLRIAAGRPIDRAALLEAVVRGLDFWLAQPPERLQAAWQEHLWGRGQRLSLLDLGKEQTVVVLGVNHDGSLRVRLPDGSQRDTTTGELLA